VLIIRVVFIFLLLNPIAFACGNKNTENTNLDPLLVYSEISANPKDAMMVLLYTPLEFDGVPIGNVLFDFDGNNQLRIPIEFKYSNEIVEVNKEGYAISIFYSNMEHLKKMQVMFNYRFPIGKNGEVKTCIKNRKYSMSALM
jgi:hypothetical protein